MAEGRYHAVDSDTELNTLPAPGYPVSSHGPGGQAPDIGYHPNAPSNATKHTTQRSHLKSHFDFPRHYEFTTVRKLILPWAWTILLTITLVVVVKVYAGKGVITSHEKDSFNGLSTALILLLGLSFFEAFKALARNLRGRIEVWFRPPEQARPLVDGFDSLLKVAELAYKRIEGVGWGLRAFCVLWILLCIIALGASALISLTYTVDDGNNYHTIYRLPGNVTIANLKCYGVHNGTICPSNITAQSLAHTYGQTILATPPGGYDQLSTTKDPDQDYPYYSQVSRNTEEAGQEFAVRFKEYNPYDNFHVYPHFTNRIIRTSSGECIEYPEVEHKDDKLGQESATKFTYQNGSKTGAITVPKSNLGNEGTTYIYNGFHSPEQAELQLCGDRCILMWAYRNPGARQNSTFFQCPIIVSEVGNATRDEHKISQSIARVAAASISLQGQFTVDQSNPSDDPFLKTNHRQFQFYADGHPWEIHYRNASKVGANLAESAIGSLATLINRNSKLNVTGSTPHLGSRLRVRWKFFEPLLILIVVAHTVVFVLNYLAIKNSPNR